jgi:type IV secretion system protein VirB5
MNGRSLLAVVLVLSSSTSFATGVPVGDAGTWAALAQQRTQLKESYDTLNKQYQTMIGSYGRGSSGLSDAIDASSIVPGSWQDVVARQQSGLYGSRETAYENVIDTVPTSTFQDQAAGSNYKMSTDSVRAAMAGGESLFDEAQTHLQNFHTLGEQVDTTTNLKDAADLQNRMAAELGMAQAAQTKLQALNTSVSANQLNAANQEAAARAKFFHDPSR